MTSAPTVVAGLAVHDLGGDPDAPTLVLLHANGDSAACWPDAARRWTPDYHVLAADMRGHGASPRFRPDQLDAPGDVFVVDTVNLLADLRRDGIPIGAVGHSLGGAALTAAAARIPDLADALVLVDPPWDTPVILGPRREVGAARRVEVVGYQQDPAGALALLREREPHWPDAEYQPWVDAKLALDLDYVETGGGRPSTPWTESVPRIQAPTLLVTGDADVITGPASRAVVAEIASSAIEVVIIPGAGHYVRHQRTEQFHAVVDPWLRAHLAGS
ncbi:MAG TPA: alpha/beta hydrolase [Lapillicoccus sp.]|nr:alpha/beta hydrolase [Lapillicoccus sp.]